jgi:transposase
VIQAPEPTGVIMSTLFWLTDEQMGRLRPFFPKSRGKPRVDDQRNRLIGRTKGGLNTKLHAVTDAKGRPLRFFMTAGQVSDYTGAAALLGSLPAAEWLIADR